MMLRRWAIVAILAFAGCESLRKPPPVPESARREVETTQLAPPAPQPSPRDGIAPVAAQILAQPPVAEPEPEPEIDSLALAAECIERGDRVNAAVHLEAYVQKHPDQLMFRLQLSELLVKLGRDDAARFHYEQVADDARSAKGPIKDQLVNVHTRLMEIAQRKQDSFAELYHRGMGLLLLLAEQEGNPDRDQTFQEEMICKALKALIEAKQLNPDNPRVRIALTDAYERSGNPRAAEIERTASRNNVVSSGLPPMLPK